MNRIIALCVLAASFCGVTSVSLAEPISLLDIKLDPFPSSPLVSGTLSLTFDEDQLWTMGIEMTPVGGQELAQNNGTATFHFNVIRPRHLDSRYDKFSKMLAAASGAIVLERDGVREIVSAIQLTHETDGFVYVHSAVNDQEGGATFALSDATWFSDDDGQQQLSGDLVLTLAAAERLGNPELSGIIVGHVFLSSGVLNLNVASANLDADDSSRTAAESDQSANQILATSPDVIVGDLHQLNSYGFDGDTSAFSVGTVSCNIGRDPLDWFFNINKHPVIGQNMYRYKAGQFEQIGMSWLKHGFFALSENLCSGGDCDGDASGEHLGPGCSDPYSANLNGQPGNLGPRSEVNAFTGVYAFPFGGAPLESLISRRLQVKNEDLSLDLNTGAEYFVEGQYVTPDDAASNNGFNNASYRKINVSEVGGGFSINFAGEDTVRTLPAIHAWQAIDPQVQIQELLIPAEGVLTLGARATDMGNGIWHYEYALHNLNSHRSAQSFSVPVFPGIVLSNIEFHDVPYHSGEPYAQTPWQVTITDDAIMWSTDDFNVDPDANALRWGTMYNFRFDANAHPDQLASTVGLFRPGTPNNITAVAPAPTDKLIAIGVVSPPYDDSKDRYISIDPSANGAQLVAIRVARMNGTESAYVSCDFEDLGTQGVFGSLVDTPEFCLWSTQVLHIGGCMIAPGNAYSVESTLDGIDFTTPLMVSTTNVPSPREYGDVVGAFVDNIWTAPDGIVSSLDIVASVQGFQLFTTAALIARLDVVPSNPNHLLAANDILSIVLGFSGTPYSFGLSCSTGTCEPDCANP